MMFISYLSKYQKPSYLLQNILYFRWLLMNYIHVKSWSKTIGLSLIFSTIMTLSLGAAPLKIMMLGDSITEGLAAIPDLPDQNQSDYTQGLIQNPDNIGYRGELWRLLKEEGYVFGAADTNLDFVGNKTGGSNYTANNPGFDENHEGHGGYTSAQIRDGIDGWLTTTPTDIVLLHIGTNDPGKGIHIGTDNDSNQDANTTVNNVKKILNSIFTANPNTKVFVARTIEARRAYNFAIDNGNWRTVTLNNNISAMINNHIQTANIKMVNLESGAGIRYDPCGTTLGDMQPYDINGYYDFHPNEHGYKKMAQKWFDDMMASGWLPTISSYAPEHLWALEENIPSYTDGIGGNSATCAGLTCPTQVLGQVNNAQNFNGSQLLTVAPNASLDFTATESYSVSFWMNAENSATNQVVVGGGNTTVGYFWIGTNGSKLKFHIRGTNDDNSIDISLGEWTQIVLVKDAIQEKIFVYLDALLVSTLNSPQSSVVFANGLGIGNLNNGYFFNGSIDEVALYREALSSEEIQEQYSTQGGIIPDTQLPVITLIGGNTQEITIGTAYVELGASVSDNVDENLIVIVDASTVDTAAEGNYTVTYNVTDTAGNVAVEVNRTVVVTEIIPTNLINTETPLNTTSRGTIVNNNDGSITMTATSNNAYLYTRLSHSGYKGALSRDLVEGEHVTVKIKAKSSSLTSYIRSSYLDFPKTYFSEVNIYEEFVFEATVKENVSASAWLGLFTLQVGDSITVESIEILESLEPETNNLINTETPLNTTSRGTMINNEDASITMIATANNAYLYIRLSESGYKGALSRDLVAGENITVKIRAKSDALTSYIRSSYLDFPKTYFSQTNTYEEFVFETTVKENVSARAWLGLFTSQVGDSITVESIEILEVRDLEVDNTPPTITLSGVNPQTLTVGDTYYRAGSNC